VETYVLRVWLPDRPGALGQVASRIGAVRGDVIGIDILERGGGRAVDDLVVSLPDGSGVELLLAEVAQVDGVAVEDVRRVPDDRPEPGILALEVAARLVEADSDKRLDLLCHEMLDLVDGAWAVAFAVGAEQTLITIGTPPDAGWLSAFLAGSSHLSDANQAAGAPGDLAWARLPTSDLAVAVGRAGRPFHARERQHLSLLGRIADPLLP
jgi:hypothetical protein